MVLLVILLKVGGYGILRTAYAIFPDGAITYAWWIGLIAVVTIVYAAFNALAMGDIKKMQESLQNQDFTKFHTLKPHFLETVDRMLATDIARLISMIPMEESQLVSEPVIKGRTYSFSVLLGIVFI